MAWFSESAGYEHPQNFKIDNITKVAKYQRFVTVWNHEQLPAYKKSQK